MEFAEQERRPEQVVTPEYQSVSPESSEPTLKELTNGADYSKMPKAFQKSHFFELPSAPAQEKAQGQSNADAPVAKTGENSDSELLGGTVAPPILLAGGLGGALPAPKNPLQSAAKAFGRGAAAFGRGAATLGRGAAALGRFGAVGGLGAAIWGWPLSRPAGDAKETEWMRRNAARRHRQHGIHPTTNNGSAAEGGKSKNGDKSKKGRNPAQDKELSKGEIDKLKQGDVDIHKIKGKKNSSKRDLFKDKDGNIYVKPKGGEGPGEDIGININDY